MLKKTALIATLAVLTSCSQSPGGSSSVGMIEAQFIDDPVKGLSFESASGKDKTGAQGKFKCKRGEIVKFKLAGLELGEAVCGEKIFVDDLTSDEVGHSPEKVAALIQSFAVKGDGEFDLSTAVSLMPEDALESFVFTGDDTAFLGRLQDVADDIKTDIPALASVVVAKDPAEMREILDTSIAQYTSLSDSLKAALSASSAQIKVTGKLVSHDPNDECYDYVQARVSVTKESGENKPYKMNVLKVANFDAHDVYNSATNECTNADWCDQSTDLPPAKIISSSSVSFMTKGYHQNDPAEGSYNSVGQLNLSVVNGQLKIAGSFHEEGNHIDEEGDIKYSCTYAVTSDDVTIPEEGPFTLENDHDGVDGAWAGQLTCTGEGSAFYDVSLVITPDSSAPEGYVADLSVEDDEAVSVAVVNPIPLVNDTETPDDNPFFEYMATFDETFSFMGYNLWDSGKYRMNLIISTDSEGQKATCTGDLDPQP